MTPPSRPAVCAFESRRAAEIEALIRTFGGEPTVAPSMREVPLTANDELLRFADDLVAGRYDIVVLMTGVGTRYLAGAVAAKISLSQLCEALQRCTLAIRGPKPAAVLKEWGVPWAIQAPEPNTWHELFAEMQHHLDLPGKMIAVQEYGTPNDEFTQALTAAGAFVDTVTVYRWELPEDCGPLREAVRRGAEQGFDVLLFTSAQQIRHVLQVADELGVTDAWRARADASFIASIGPTCSDALREAGLHVDFEASPPKLGPLVRGALGTWSAG